MGTMGWLQTITRMHCISNVTSHKRFFKYRDEKKVSKKAQRQKIEAYILTVGVNKSI